MYSATLSNSTGIISGRHMITLKAEIENTDWTGIKLNIDSLRAQRLTTLHRSKIVSIYKCSIFKNCIAKEDGIL